MAGAPWEPDLADVLEADTPSIAVDTFTATVVDHISEDCSKNADETVQALLMLNDTFECGDIPTESYKHKEPAPTGLKEDIENMDHDINDRVSNISIQEIQFSESLFAETRVATDYKSEPSNTAEVSDTLDKVESVTAIDVTAPADNREDIVEQITVLHSTLGQEEDQAVESSENVCNQPPWSPGKLVSDPALGQTKSFNVCNDPPVISDLAELEHVTEAPDVDLEALLPSKELIYSSINIPSDEVKDTDTSRAVDKVCVNDTVILDVNSIQAVISTDVKTSLVPVSSECTLTPAVDPTDDKVTEPVISNVEEKLSAVPDVSQGVDDPLETLTTVDCTVEEAFLVPCSAEPEDAEVAALTGGAAGQYVVYGGDGSQYIISESPHNQCMVTESLSLEDQMRALHGPSPEPSPTPTFLPAAVPDLLSLVVQETIPLRLNMSTGEMEPDVEAGKGLVPTQSGAWVTPRQEEVFNIISESLEVFPQDDVKLTKSSPLKKSGSESSVKKGSNVATVKPFNSSNSQKSSKSSKPPKISTSPIKLKAVLASSPTPSSFPRPPSSVKCQCARHMVIGYPPAKVFYWTVGTTPGINSTYMDFDNQGVKFLYDHGDLKSFQAVLSSFKPEFLSTEKSLEVSLCLSCVRWAENEYKSVKEKRKVEVENAKKEKERTKKFEAAKKEKASMNISEDEMDKTFKSKFKCVICKKLVSSPLEFKVHVKDHHQKNASSNLESKRSSTSSKCKCLSHIDIFHGYSFMEQPPVSFRMNFTKTEDNSLALRFYKENSMLADSEPSLLCSFCVHFANQQVDKTRPKSPTKRVTLTRKRSPSPISRKVKQRKRESSSSDNSSSSSDSSSYSSSGSEDDEPEDGACDVPGCKAVLKSPAALASHMKTKHPELQNSQKSLKKYKSGVIKPVRVNLQKLSKEDIESMTSPTSAVEAHTDVEDSNDEKFDITKDDTESVPDETIVVNACNNSAQHVQEAHEESTEDATSLHPPILVNDGDNLDKPDIDHQKSKEEMDDNQNQISIDSDTSADVLATEVSIKNPQDEIVETKAEENLPVLSARKQKALDALKIDMVADTFSPGISRRGRNSRNGKTLDEPEIKTSNKDVQLKDSVKKSTTRGRIKSGETTSDKINEAVDKEPKSPAKSDSKDQEQLIRSKRNAVLEKDVKDKDLKETSDNEVQLKLTSSRVTRRSGDCTVQNDEDEMLNSSSKSPAGSGKSLINQLKMDLVDESVTPCRFSRRKEVVEIAGKTGNKLLDQLKVDMVVDAILPTRGKRRAENDLDQKNAKRTKIAPVEQVPPRQKAFAAKIFRRIQGGDITKSLGHSELIGRIPGLTHVGFGKEYNRWVRENPETEDKKVEPDDENNHVDEENEDKTPVPESPKKMSINLVNVLTTEENLVQKDLVREKYMNDRQRKSSDDQVGNLEKLKSIKDSLVEILSTGDLKDEEKRLLKEIKDLIEID